MEDAHENLRNERHRHRAEQQARLDELQPRAEAGTKERQLEKRRELAASNRQFAQAKEGGDMAEVAEADLMGGDAGADFKRRKMEMERKKNDREVRRDEIMRARRLEREEKARAFKEREEKTMDGLIELARSRFG